MTSTHVTRVAARLLAHVLAPVLGSVLTLAIAPAAHAEEETGTLPGSAFATVGLEVGSLTAKTAVAAPATPTLGVPTEVSGFFGAVRSHFGGYMRVTRFGSEVGLEGTAALGFASPDAIDPTGDGNWVYDFAGGINAALFRLDTLGLALKVVGGIGFNQDHGYLYAGGRLGLEPSADFGLELGYTFSSGDSYGEDVPWQEHRLGGTLVLRSASLAVTGEYWFGEAIRYVGEAAAGGGARPQQVQKDQLFKGDYSAIVLKVSYCWF